MIVRAPHGAVPSLVAVFVVCFLLVASPSGSSPPTPAPDIATQVRSPAAATKAATPASSADTASEPEAEHAATVVRIVPGVFTGDLRDLPLARQWRPGDPIVEMPSRRFRPVVAQSASPSAASDESARVLGDTTRLPGDVVPRSFSPPDLNFDGSAFTNVVPPDPVGDVGRNHYVQMVNLPPGVGSQLTVFDKSGTIQSGPVELDSMWSDPAGNPCPTCPCATGTGDPVVLYDADADRWLLSEFANTGNHLCVYVSRTSDPVIGGYFNYDFPTSGFPDYPKYAVWPDAYYVSTNELPNAAAYALERVAMLVGGPAALYRRWAPPLPGFDFNTLTPADLDGPMPPPVGSPAFFMRHRDDELHLPATPGSDRLEIREFRVDWAAPALTTLSPPIYVTVAEFDSAFCGGLGAGGGDCLPQPLVSSGLDPLREPIMWRLQYRNFGSHESLVGSFSTDTDPGAAIHAGVRWFELRRSPPGGGFWTVFQEGTQVPDADNRWMGSIAMDGCGNIALGYSVASATTFPGINYAGRLASDPLGTLPVGEATLIAGSGSQQSSRWGDYSAMVVDEVDQCTFWYTAEYLPNVPSATNAQWRTRIASFRFDSCGLPPSPGDEVPNTSVRVAKEPLSPTLGIRLDWLAVTNATTYNVYRGDIDSLFVGRVYNHAASGATGAGACDQNATFLIDPDDQLTPGPGLPDDYYYLIAAKSCLVEGTTGFDSFGVERPVGSGCP